jgi:hypothetical protein
MPLKTSRRTIVLSPSSKMTLGVGADLASADDGTADRDGSTAVFAIQNNILETATVVSCDNEPEA